MAKKVVVVRIGAKTTHIVHMEYMTKDPTIYGCIRIPTPEGACDDGMIRDAMEVGQRLKKACKEKGIHTTDAIFTVESSKIANRETTIPYVAKAKVRQNVMAKVPDLFPVDSERYVFSYVLQGKNMRTIMSKRESLAVRFRMSIFLLRLLNWWILIMRWRRRQVFV